MQKIEISKREMSSERNEALNLLRTNLQFFGKDKKVILFTSTTAVEGRSQVALDLCRVLAQAGSRVILIDGDLRNPATAEWLPKDGETGGLSRLLAGRCALSDVLRETDVENLRLIPAGTTPPNPLELLAGKQMQELLETCRREYDYVILDCSPIGTAFDASVAARLCDGAILVVGSGRVSYSAAQNALERLQNAGCPILGAVLNQVDRKNDRFAYQNDGGDGSGRHFWNRVKADR